MTAPFRPQHDEPNARRAAGPSHLLHLPDGHLHRLGRGVPLSFGSVSIRITRCDLRDGRALAPHDERFGDSAETVMLDRDRLVDDYRLACRGASVESKEIFEKLPLIAAFPNACKGSSLPLRYPRPRAAPDREGKQHERLVENERLDKGKLVHGLALRAGWQAARGLPHFHGTGAGPASDRQAGGGRSGAPAGPRTQYRQRDRGGRR